MKFIKNLSHLVILLMITCFLFSCDKESVTNENELTTDEISLNIDDEELRKSFGEEGINIISQEEEYKRLLEFAAEDKELQNLIEQYDENLSTMTSRSTSYCNFWDWWGLKYIYNGLQGDNWDDRRGWDVIADNSTYPGNCDLRGIEGVSMHDNINAWYTNQTNLGRVRYVSLTNLGNLQGYISSGVRFLTYLNGFKIQQIGSSNNIVTGSIPSDFADLSSFYYLILTDLDITGSIPPELGSISSLRYFYLRDNPGLSGSIPAEIGDLTLSRVLLDDNNLSGCYDSNLQNLCSVRYWAKTHISRGNNFDESFANFCSNGSGTCP